MIDTMFNIFFIFLKLTCCFATSNPFLELHHEKMTTAAVCRNGTFCQEEQCIHIAQAILTRVDQTVNPCDNFFEFACGKWMKQNEHQLGEKSFIYGVNTNEMSQRTDDILKDLIKKKRKIHDTFYETQSYKNIKNFYTSCLNEDDIKRKEMKPAIATLLSLKHFFVKKPFDKSKWNLSEAIVEMALVNGSPLFGVNLEVDFRNSSRWIPVITSPSHDGLIRSDSLSKTFAKSLIADNMQASKLKSSRENFKRLQFERATLFLRHLINGLKGKESRKMAVNVARSIQKTCFEIKQRWSFGDPSRETSFYHRIFEENGTSFSNNVIDKVQLDKNSNDAKIKISTADLKDYLANYENPKIDLRKKGYFENDNSNEGLNLTSSQADSDVNQSTIQAEGLNLVKNLMLTDASYNDSKIHDNNSEYVSILNKRYSNNSQKETKIDDENARKELTNLIVELFQEVNTISDNDNLSLPMNMSFNDSMDLINEILKSEDNVQHIQKILENMPQIDGSLVFDTIMSEYHESEIKEIQKLLQKKEIIDLFIFNNKESSSSNEEKLQHSQRKHATQEVVTFLRELRTIELTEREKIELKHSPSVFETMTIGELQQEYPFVQWQYILKNLLENELNEDQQIILFHKKYFDRLKIFIEDKRAWVIHYAMLSLYIHDELMELVTVKNDGNREKLCLKVTKDLMKGPLTYVYFQYLGKGSIQQLENEIEPLIYYLTMAAKKVLTRRSFLTQSDKAAIRKKIDQMKWEIGGYKGYLNITYVENLQNELLIQQTNFYDNVMSVYKNVLKRRSNVFNEPVNSSKHIWLFTAESYVVNAFYFQNTNSIILPEGFFYPPYYYSGAPAYTLFAGAGVAFAHEIMHAFDTTGIYFDENGEVTYPFSKAMQDGLMGDVDCYNNLLEQNFKVVENIEGMNIEIQTDTTISRGENLADILGMEIAYNAYLELIKDIGEEDPILPGLKYSQLQLFFISFAQPYCAVISKEGKLILNYLDEHMMNNIRVDGLMKIFSPFSQAFSCITGREKETRGFFEKCQRN